MILQPRDVEMLAFLSRVRFATRDHFAALFFGPRSPFPEPGQPSPGRDRCKVRLQKLWQHRYLHRLFFPPYMIGLEGGRTGFAAIANGPAVYALTARGAEAVATSQARPTRVVPYERKPSEASPSLIYHELAAVELHVAAATAPSAALLSWDNTREAYHRYEYAHPITGQAVAAQLAPDAHLRLAFAGTPVHVFLEVDRGTESVRHRIRKKVADYTAYRERGAFAGRYWDEADRTTGQAPSFRVVFLTTQTDWRLESLKAEAERAGKQAYWFTTRSKLLAAADPFAEPIWQRAGHEGWRPFWVPAERYFKRVRPAEPLVA